ncbi:MAG: Protein GrpE [Eubacteriales bacterium SKADARSKE-1]|nr:Protein GrpE [Eubacteriales bacterium SKADARSKE-1]
MTKDQMQKEEENQGIEEIRGDLEDIKQDISEIEKLQKELVSQKDLFLRVAAEYDNYRKRTERDKSLIYADATANTVSVILPIADNLELAGKAFSDAPSEYQKGLELVINQLQASFEKLGIEAFGFVGDHFNPDIHNAIAHVDDENAGENTVVEVFQKGYKLNDKIIRHAMVKVAN